MRKVVSLLASGVLMALLAFGSSFSAGAVEAISGQTMATSEGTIGGTAGRCCWTYYMGHWWCIPC